MVLDILSRMEQTVGEGGKLYSVIISTDKNRKMQSWHSLDDMSYSQGLYIWELRYKKTHHSLLLNVYLVPKLK